jgi:ABC-type sugar transport system substrate-binding protein
MNRLGFYFGWLINFAIVSCAVAESGKRHKIGALTESLANPYFLQAKRGFDYAQRKFGVDIVFGSTLSDDAPAEQLSILQNWLNEGGFDGLIVTPVRGTSLNTALAEAGKRGIPIVNIDELIPAAVAEKSNVKLLARIASNNFEAGKLQGEFLAKLLPEHSQVAIIAGPEGTMSSDDRVNGFTSVVVKRGLALVANRPADFNRTKGFYAAARILKYIPDIKAIFAANDEMGLGAVHAVQDANASGRVVILSVDGTPEGIEAVRQGFIAGTVAQYPDAMAFMAVECIVKKLNGEQIQLNINSPIKLITKDNADEARNFYKDE